MEQMKLPQIVKEFGVNGKELKQKDVIDLLKGVGIEKKSGAVLEGEELDIFLTLLTLGNQLNNMKDYLTGKAILDSELPKPEKVVKPEPKKPEPKPQPEKKAAQPANNPAERKPEPKPEPRPEPKPEAEAAPAEPEAPAAEEAPVEE